MSCLKCYLEHINYNGLMIYVQYVYKHTCGCYRPIEEPLIILLCEF